MIVTVKLLREPVAILTVQLLHFCRTLNPVKQYLLE